MIYHDAQFAILYCESYANRTWLTKCDISCEINQILRFFSKIFITCVISAIFWYFYSISGVRFVKIHFGTQLVFPYKIYGTWMDGLKKNRGIHRRDCVPLFTITTPNSEGYLRKTNEINKYEYIKKNAGRSRISCFVSGFGDLRVTCE